MRSTPSILLVDDDEGFLASLASGLSDLVAGCDVLTAADGLRAVEAIESRPIELLVTDLNMPGMSGFELMAYLGRHHPRIRTIVMSAFGPPDMEAYLDIPGMSGYVEKPIDIARLASLVDRALGAPEDARHAHGVPRSSEAFLVAAREAVRGRHDGEVVVRCAENVGRVYFSQGSVVWAVASTTGQTFVSLLADRATLSMNDLRSVYESCRQTGGNFGETLVEWGLLDEATVRALLLEHVALGVAHLTAWTDGDVLFVPEKRTYRGTIRFDLDEVLRFARTLQNEQRLRDMAERVLLRVATPEPRLPAARTPDGSTVTAEEGVSPEPARPQKSDPRSAKVEEILEPLRAIYGFIGVAAFTPTGDLIAEVSVAGTRLGELGALGALANEVLLKSQTATDLMGVGRGSQVHLSAPKANILASCLNENADFSKTEPGRAHVHLMLILAPEGNLGLGKLQLEKVIQQVAPLVR